MDHTAHAPGTREDCPGCRALAYEPGWYKAIRDGHTRGSEDDLSVLELDDYRDEIVVSSRPEVVVPDLEGSSTPEDPAR